MTRYRLMAILNEALDETARSPGTDTITWALNVYRTKVYNALMREPFDETDMTAEEARADWDKGLPVDLLHFPADLADTSPQLFITRPTLVRCEGSSTGWLLVTPQQKEEK